MSRLMNGLDETGEKKSFLLPDITPAIFFEIVEARCYFVMLVKRYKKEIRSFLFLSFIHRSLGVICLEEI